MASDLYRHSGENLSSISFLTEDSTAAKNFIEQCFTKAHTERNETVISFLNAIALNIGLEKISLLEGAIEQLHSSKGETTSLPIHSEVCTQESNTTLAKLAKNTKSVVDKLTMDCSDNSNLAIQTQNTPNVLIDVPSQSNAASLSRVMGKFSLD